MSVAQALQGEVPGLNFSVGNAGGSLKSRMGLNIRGIGTIGDGSNAAPLVLIDGSEGDLYSISPNDIESISVLRMLHQVLSTVHVLRLVLSSLQLRVVRKVVERFL